MKILIIRLGAIGDIVRTLPAVKFLHEKIYETKAEIHWIAESHNADVLYDLPYIKKVISLPRKEWQSKIFSTSCLKVISNFHNIIKELKKENYDIAVDFHGIFKSGLLSYLSNASIRLGYEKKHCKEFNYIFNNFHIPVSKIKISRYEKNFTLLSYFKKNIILSDAACLNIFEITEKEKRSVDQILSVISRTTGIISPILIGIQPAVSVFGRNKEWNEKKYSELCGYIIREIKNSVIVFNWWGESEYEKIGRIINQSTLSEQEKKRIALIPKLSFRERADFFSRLAVFITPDTGPMYIASLAGTFVLALFGPSDPVLYEPYGENHYILSKNVDCSPCRNRSCKNLKCMDMIESKYVFNKLKEILKNN